MPTRKVQKVGGSTYTVSVPKEWASEQRLRAGDEVHLYTHEDGSLVVRPTPRNGGRFASTTIRLPDDSAETVEASVAAAYCAGYESVTLEPADTFTDEQRRALRTAVRNRVGVEVVEESTAGATVRSVLDTAEVSVRQSVIQLEFVACSMHRTATAALAGSDGPNREQLRERAAEATRHADLVTRHLNRSLAEFGETDSLGVGRTDLFGYYRTARELERVADQALTLDSLAGHVDEALPELDRVLAVAEEVRGVVDDATNVLYGSADAALAHDAMARCRDVDSRVEALQADLFETGNESAYVAARALDALGETAAGARTIAAVATEKHM